MQNKDLLKKKLILRKSKRNIKKNGLMKINKKKVQLKRIERRMRLPKLNLLRLLSTSTRKNKPKNLPFKR
jgi:hypothetical protein